MIFVTIEILQMRAFHRPLSSLTVGERLEGFSSGCVRVVIGSPAEANEARRRYRGLKVRRLPVAFKVVDGVLVWWGDPREPNQGECP